MSKDKDTPTREVTATSEYGKPLYGKLVTITCAKRGCKTKRTIKVQDQFQVRFCREHQKEHALERRRERAKAKREAEAKKKPKAKAPAKAKANVRSIKSAKPKGTTAYARAINAVERADWREAA
jgi:hypothetical protein